MEVHSFVYMPSLELCEQSVAASAAETAPAAVNATIPDLAAADKPAADKPAVNADPGPAAALPVTAEPLASASPAADEPAAKAAENQAGTHTAPAPAVRARRFWQVSTRRLIVLACIVLGMRIFVGEASVVPTASMEGTILVGDHLFMDKLLYGPEIPLVHWRLPMVKTIRRGDIIVFHYPRDPSETFLKRVTAVGGDSLEIRGGVLFVNSQPVQEPYAVHHAPLHSPQESWGPVVVPDGKLFVMGDNRDNSSDSRDWGFVPVGNVIGEPMFVYWSYDAPTARWLDENPGHRITFYASIAENFFSNTRWNRTGMLL